MQSALTLIFVAAPMFACASIRLPRAVKTRSMESRLTAAGFRTIPADSAATTTRLGALTPYELVRIDRHGRAYWYYADPKCPCVYVGNDAAYDRFKQNAGSEHASAPATTLNGAGEGMDTSEDFLSPENPELYGAPENW